MIEFGQRLKTADLYPHTNLDTCKVWCNSKIIYNKILDILPKRGPGERIR